MHPGPMNRGIEIDTDTCYWTQSSIQEQVKTVYLYEWQFCI